MDDAKGPPSIVVSKEEANANRLFWLGAGASIAYILVLTIYSWSVRHAMLGMSPDQFATFLSGVFAPLAFLWLVLGFRQQGDELKNSAKALWLQGEELRNSVEQQRQLVELSREQLMAEYQKQLQSEAEADHAAQPQLILPRPGGFYSGGESGDYVAEFKILSAGPVCSGVWVAVNGTRIAEAQVLDKNQEIRFRIESRAGETIEPKEISIDYVDLRGRKKTLHYHVPIEQTGPYGRHQFGAPEPKHIRKPLPLQPRQEANNP